MNPQDEENKVTEEILENETGEMGEAEKIVSEQEVEMENLRTEKKEWEEKFLRTSADLQNVRRRAEEDRIKARHDGIITGISPFLSLVDTMERAFAHISPEMEETDLVKGMRAMHKNCAEKLKNLGVEFFGEVDENFDEQKHESLLVDANTEMGKIAMVFEKGVSLNGKIISHAKVSVGTKA